ncbi:MAG: S-adenosylmethionine:tRNA ribosyltransferase-isomerase [Pyrinomonadaceae bacterium]
MIAADQAVQRPPHAKLLVVDAGRHIGHYQRSEFVEFLHSKDLVIANDAATLPASLQGMHARTGSPVEVRLAGRPSLKPEDVRRFSAVIFGKGDFHVRTEDRQLPPQLAVGDRLELGPLSATVEQLLGHPRLVSLLFNGSADEVWAGLARHGRPIQYAHMKTPLALWDVWTRIAGQPVAFETPSAGFALDWRLIDAIRRHGAEFATITHAAGISSTGDEDLDRLLPFDEPYRIPEATTLVIERTRSRGGRVVAIGTTVVRALEDAAIEDGRVRSGDGLATQHLGPTSRLRVVDAILSGTHEPGTSHYELLRAFLDDATLFRTTKELDAGGYRTHEFGDSVLIERVRG